MEGDSGLKFPDIGISTERNTSSHFPCLIDFASQSLRKQLNLL